MHHLETVIKQECGPMMKLPHYGRERIGRQSDHDERQRYRMAPNTETPYIESNTREKYMEGSVEIICDPHSHVNKDRPSTRTGENGRRKLES